MLMACFFIYIYILSNAAGEQNESCDNAVLVQISAFGALYSPQQFGNHIIADIETARLLIISRSFKINSKPNRVIR